MSRQIGFLFLALLVLIALDSCQKESPTESSAIWVYQYTAHDTNGSVIVQGWMTLNTSDSSHVRGEWHFSKVGNPQNIGPHVGADSLTGGFYQSTLSLNLNRQFVDNNVFLTGDLDTHSFKGTWIWSGFPGVLNHGTFEAVR